MSRFVGRANAAKRLAPLDGTPGRSVYADHTARFEMPGETLVVTPPFPLRHAGEYDVVRVRPLLEEIAEDHLAGAVLVRLGGYAVGVFEGERLVASKVGTRFVKGRHKKGGSSANRFRRRREEQERELLDAATATARAVLEPFRDRIEYLALAGDRGAATEVADRLPWLADRRLGRFFDVPDPRQRVLERLPYDLYAAEVSEEPARP